MADVVIKIGRRRVTEPLMTALIKVSPFCRQSLENCVINIPCLEIKPTKVISPILVYKFKSPPVISIVAIAPTIDKGTVNKIINGST